MAFRFTPPCCCEECQACSNEDFEFTQWWVGASVAETAIKQIRGQDCHYGYIAIMAKDQLPVISGFTYRRIVDTTLTEEVIFPNVFSNYAYYRYDQTYAYPSWSSGNPMDLTWFSGGQVKTFVDNGVEYIEANNIGERSKLYDYTNRWCAAQWMRCRSYAGISESANVFRYRYLIGTKSVISPDRIFDIGSVSIPSQDFYISGLRVLPIAAGTVVFDGPDSYGRRGTRDYNLTARQFIEAYLSGNLVELTGDSTLRSAELKRIEFAGTLSFLANVRYSYESPVSESYSSCGNVLYNTGPIGSVIDSIPGYIRVSNFCVPIANGEGVIQVNVYFETPGYSVDSQYFDQQATYSDIVDACREHTTNLLTEYAMQKVTVNVVDSIIMYG